MMEARIMPNITFTVNFIVLYSLSTNKPHVQEMTVEGYIMQAAAGRHGLGSR